MLTRRSTLKLAARLAALPLAARAENTPPAPFTIFQITYRGETDVERGFRDYLEQRGIPVRIISRSADLDPARVPEILEEVRAVRPDLVYTWGTPVTAATFGTADDVDARRHITDIPGVFTMVASPEGAGLVATRASSGRNITGTSHVVPPEPQIRAMGAYRPFDTLGVLYTPTEQNARVIVEELRALSPAMGFRLVERTFALGADGRPTVDGAAERVEALAAEGAQWLYYLPDTFLSTNIDHVAPVATALRLPGFSATQLLERDALISLISRYYSLGQLTAYKAEQILLHGAAPADLPVETLKRFALIVNMPLARELEMYPPLAMLNYAHIITE